MEWITLHLVGTVGGLVLLLLIGVAIWDRWHYRRWQGLLPPTPFWYVAVEWAVFMLMFVTVLEILQWAWRLTCHFCE